MASRNRNSSRGSADGPRAAARSSYDEALRERDARRHSPGSSRPLPLLLVALFAVVAVRLVWLQVIDAPNLAARAESSHTTNVTLTAKRGTIYDRNGNVLATSVECRTLYCNPSVVTDKNAAAAVLAEKLGGEAADYLETLSQDTTFAYLERQVDTSVADEVVSALSEADIEGVYELADVKRVYPYGSVAGQVLGFIGTNGHGLSGLELYYDDILSGTDGEMVMERGRDGTPVAGGVSEIREAADGTDVFVSLDVNIQQVAEEQLSQTVTSAEAASGNVVVMEPSSGEILAIASTPLFDPTNSSTLTDEALKLSCVSDSYEPGSTFKVLTMAVGYDTQTINQSSTFTVPAKVKVGDDEVGDVDGRDYAMDMTPYEIMRRSSNAGAALVGYAIGADAFAEGIARFGIGQATGIDYPGEVAGLVSERDEYSGATVGAMAFGQSLAIPSIQMVRAVAAIANDGQLATPHLLVQKGDEVVSWPAGDQAVSAEAAELVTQDMIGVVEEGTGTYAQMDGYTIAGKTGTGEQASAEGGYEQDSYMSSFVGFIDSASNKVLAYVGVYGTSYHGGDIAAPAFSAIMSEAVVDLSIPRSD